VDDQLLPFGVRELLGGLVDGGDSGPDMVLPPVTAR
jgi:hypothetical protein